MKNLFKTLYPLLQKHKLKMFFIMLFSLASGLKGIIPLLLQKLTDGWIKEDKKITLILPLCVFLIWVLSSLFRYFQTVWLKKLSILTVSKLRCQLMHKYLNANLYLLRKFSTHSGHLMSRLISDLEQLYEGTIHIAEFIREPILVGILFFYLLYLNIPLALFVIVILFITFWTSKKVAKSIRKYSHQNQESMGKLVSDLKENLDGIRIIQAFNLQSKFNEKFIKQTHTFLKTKEKVILRETIMSPIFNIVTSFFMTCLIYYINFLIFQKQFTVGEFTGFVGTLFMLTSALRTFQGSYIRLQQSVTALDRFQNLMKAPLEITQKAPKKAFPENWKDIEFKNVSFSYDKKEVLQNINFKVKRGDLIAIVGESGSGKSTLINLLARFFDPHQGEILIDKIPLSNLPINVLRQNIALVSQEIFLFKDTIEKNIWAGKAEPDPQDPLISFDRILIKNEKKLKTQELNQLLNPEDENLSHSQQEIKRASKEAGAHEFIQKLEHGYKTEVGERGFHLSGGEKQRISIARAFFKNANILLLDEPTSALDSKSEKIIQQSLNQLIKGRTTFMTTHRMSMTVRAQKILVLKKGHLVEEGLHEDLLKKKGEYFKLHYS